MVGVPSCKTARGFVPVVYGVHVGEPSPATSFPDPGLLAGGGEIEEITFEVFANELVEYSKKESEALGMSSRLTMERVRK